jgi:hypothetical protein
MGLGETRRDAGAGPARGRVSSSRRAGLAPRSRYVECGALCPFEVRTTGAHRHTVAQSRTATSTDTYT